MWEKHKMNVKVAAQTLSASVADALDFLHDEIAHPGFTESEATSQRMDVAFWSYEQPPSSCKRNKTAFNTSILQKVLGQSK